MTEPLITYRLARETLPPDEVAMYGHAWSTVVMGAANAVYHDGIDVRADASLPRPREAARLAAHAIRIRHGRDDADWVGGPLLDARTGAAIDSIDPDVRFPEGLALLRSIQGDPSPASEPVRLIGKWLAPHSTHDFATSGHLARWFGQHAREYAPHLGPAWWRTHGDEVIAQLTEDTESTPGRPATAEESTRWHLRTAVVRRWTAGDITKSLLARQAHVSRPTLDSWLASL